MNFGPAEMPRAGVAGLTARGEAAILGYVMLATISTVWQTGAAHWFLSALDPLGFMGSTNVLAVAQHVVFSVVALILCVAVHEFGHAYVADRLGDPLPRMQGRVTLNPLAHIDPLGTVLFPALMALGVGVPLAWGKPVQISEHPRLLTRRFSLRTIRLLISVAGPAMNLLLALVISVVFVGAARLHLFQVANMAATLILLNLGLMFFNLLPVPPLDGRSFLAFLPDSLAVVRDGLTSYGGYIFLALIFLGGIGQGRSPLQYIMLPFTLVSEAYIRLLAQLGGLA